MLRSKTQGPITKISMISGKSPIFGILRDSKRMPWKGFHIRAEGPASLEAFRRFALSLTAKMIPDQRVMSGRSIEGIPWMHLAGGTVSIPRTALTGFESSSGMWAKVGCMFLTRAVD